MKAVILAGGYGTRMGNLTKSLPKPMLRIGNKPIMWHIMKTYSSFGINDFIICTGFKYKKIESYFIKNCGHKAVVSYIKKKRIVEIKNYNSEGWNIVLVYTGNNTNTGGRIKKVKKYIGKETFCLTYGDGVGDIDIKKLIEFHARKKVLATVTAVHPTEKFGIIQFNGDKTKVHTFLEKPKRKDWINGGFFVLEPEVLGYIKNDSTVWEEGPLTDLTKMKMLAAYRHMGFWQCMDTAKDRKELNVCWMMGKAPWKVWR